MNKDLVISSNKATAIADEVAITEEQVQLVAAALQKDVLLTCGEFLASIGQKTWFKETKINLPDGQELPLQILRFSTYVSSRYLKPQQYNSVEVKLFPKQFLREQFKAWCIGNWDLP